MSPLSAATVDMGTAAPVGDKLFSLDYDWYFRRAVMSSDVSDYLMVGPLTPTRLDFDNHQSPSLNLVASPAADRLRLLAIADESYLSSRYSSGVDIFSLAGGFRYQPSRVFGVLALFKLDRAKALDPDYTGKKWRGLAGDLETGALYVAGGGASAVLGRQRVFWGPRPQNLILSATAEPLDLFSVAYHRGILSFTFLTARLDQSRPDSVDYDRFPETQFNDNRYLVGHRLDVKLHRRLRVGVSETSLYGGEGRSLELYYLNPFQVFHTVQLNEQLDDNTIIGGDFVFLPGKGFCVYGQGIVDDYQVDDRSAGDKEPNEIALMAGVFRAGKSGTIIPDVRLEYTRIANRTYHQVLPRNRYLYRNKLLTSPLGPDADSLSLDFRWWAGPRQSAELALAYSRHGEGSIYGPWDAPWLETEGSYDEPFPSGTIQKSLSIAVRVQGHVPVDLQPWGSLFVSLEAGYSDFTNRFNIEALDRGEGWLKFGLSWLGAHDLFVGD